MPPDIKDASISASASGESASVPAPIFLTHLSSGPRPAFLAKAKVDGRRGPIDHLRLAVGLIPGKRPRARRLDKASSKTVTAEQIAAVIIGEGLAQAGRQAIAYPDHRHGWCAAGETVPNANLDINRAHCHRLEGPASNSGLFLTFGESVKRRWGHRKRPVAAGRGSGGYTYDIDPGKATSSILIFRMKSQDPGIMMPELGRSLVHSEAVTMLEAWIDQME